MYSLTDNYDSKQVKWPVDDIYLGKFRFWTVKAEMVSYSYDWLVRRLYIKMVLT